MLPDGWIVKTIDDIAVVKSGGTPSRKEPQYWGGDVPWVTTTEVQFKIIVNTEQKITALGLENSSAKLFPAGTILMAMYGQGKTRGQIAMLGIEASTNQACAAILIKDDFHTDFYFQYLQGQYDNIRNLSNSGGQKNLSSGLVKTIKVPAPPLPEQKKIAKILSTWDQAITTTEQLISNSQQQKKALMQQLLTGKKRLAGFSGEWEELSLGSLGKTFSGLTGKSKEDFGVGNYYIPYMNIFKSGKIDINGFDKVNITEDEKQNFVKFGDIFFTTSSETPQEVGMSSVLLDEVNDVYLNSFCFGFRLHNFELLYPDFAQFLFRGSVVRRKISVLAQGATRYNISKIQMLKIILDLPSVEEQQKIAQVLSSADQEIETLQQKLNFLKEEKKALMQQLLTGKRRVILDD